MSECVVRMDMPKDKDCLLNFNLPMIGPWCWIEDRECDYCKTNNRPDWCPILCQLPEGHGRLGDLDALLEQHKPSVFTKVTDFTEGQRSVVANIKNAPTIVPAEMKGE